MAEYTLLTLPPGLRIESAEAVGRRTVPLDVARVGIVGFSDASWKHAGIETPLWPVPLLQIDGEPIVRPRRPAHFYSLGYNAISKLVGNEAVKNQWESFATPGENGHGKSGLKMNFAHLETAHSALPKDLLSLPEEERRRVATKAVQVASEKHGPLNSHDLEAYLFEDGPIAYDQVAFETAVKQTIDRFSLSIHLV